MALKRHKPRQPTHLHYIVTCGACSGQFGAVLVFVATGAILGLIIGLVRWLTLALAWWVGLREPI